MNSLDHRQERVGTKKESRTKIDRYAWASPAGKPGTFENIHKSALQIDHSYQRPEHAVDQYKVTRIASEWSWPALTVIVVARRRDGSLWVVDGQHRLLAALKRADVSTLPCIVFCVDSYREEAEAFLAINTSRKPLGALAKFPALLESRNPAAMLIQELVTSVGRVVGNQPSGQHVRCISLLLHLAEKNREELVCLWPLLGELFIGRPMDERVIDGLVYIEHIMAKSDETISASMWRKRVLKVGVEKMKDGAIRAAAFYKKGGARVYARGIVNALNYNCRIHLKVFDDED